MMPSVSHANTFKYSLPQTCSKTSTTTRTTRPLPPRLCLRIMTAQTLLLRSLRRWPPNLTPTTPRLPIRSPSLASSRPQLAHPPQQPPRFSLTPWGTFRFLGLSSVVGEVSCKLSRYGGFVIYEQERGWVEVLCNLIRVSVVIGLLMWEEWLCLCCGC